MSVHVHVPAGTTTVSPAAAAGLCDRLTLPVELGLACTPINAGLAGVAVEPTGGGFAALSRMTVRQLDRAARKGLVHPNNAARHKSQLAAAVKKLG